MSSRARKLDQKENQDAQEGGFEKDYNPFWKSDLFHPVYLRNDVPEIFKSVWSEGEEGNFGLFCNAFRNLSEKYESDEFHSWSERTTIRNWITPVLEMLGYCETGSKAKDLFLEDEPFTFEGRTHKPDYIIVNRSSDLRYIQAKEGEDKVGEAREYVKLIVEAKYWGRLDDFWNNKAEDKKRADKKNKEEIEGIDPSDQILRYMKMLNNDWGS